MAERPAKSSTTKPTNIPDVRDIAERSTAGLRLTEQINISRWDYDPNAVYDRLTGDRHG